MDVTGAEAALRDLLLKGVAAELFWADEAKSLVHEIGNHAAAINASGFGDLFGPLQVMLSDRQTLCVTKLYEVPKRRYPTRSIPAVLALLEEHTALWHLHQPHILQKLLVDAGASREITLTASHDELIRGTIDYYSSTIPTSEVARNTALARALRALRESRDKVIAHNEAVDKASRQPITWEETEQLVNYAKDLIATVSFAFLGLYVGSNHTDYLISSDARKSSLTLRQLLARANLERVTQ